MKYKIEIGSVEGVVSGVRWFSSIFVYSHVAGYSLLRRSEPYESLGESLQFATEYLLEIRSERDDPACSNCQDNPGLWESKFGMPCPNCQSEDNSEKD